MILQVAKLGPVSRAKLQGWIVNIRFDWQKRAWIFIAQKL